MAQGAYAALDGIGSTPGVQSAAAVWPLPDSQIAWTPTVNFKDRLREPRTEPSVEAADVSHAYFKTMGITLRQGRVFEAGDRHASSTVLIVNETFGKRFYPGESVLGKQVRMIGATGAAAAWKEIVGVVGDTRR